jgi:hypothetical protein
MRHKGLNQLVCAATINRQFRDMLLQNPAQALATGYQGQTFALTPEEQEFVSGIQAQYLEDFATQVFNWISANDTRYVHTVLPSMKINTELCLR